MNYLISSLNWFLLIQALTAATEFHEIKEENSKCAFEKKKRLKRILNCLLEVEHSFDSKKTEYTNNSVREEVSNRDAKHVRLTSRWACWRSKESRKEAIQSIGN